MFEGLSLLGNVNLLFVFLEGILSFLSPCVLPIVPLYIGYLAGNGKIIEEDGNIKYVRRKVIINTIFFVIGISTSFFIIGASVTSLSAFLKGKSSLFSEIAGILIILLGFIQLGLINFKFVNRTFKFNLDISKYNMNPIIAYIMGFLFSFAWTPCVGPALSSVLLAASSFNSAFAGNMLILLYTAGFALPFLLIAVFTTTAMNFIKNNKRIVAYTTKIGGIIMVAMGILTFTGKINNISSFMGNGNINNSTVQSEEAENKDSKNEVKEEDEMRPNIDIFGEQFYDNYLSGNDKELLIKDNKYLKDASDFSLTDQYGNVHKLSDYRGKTVFLNFWATWCSPCRVEMPYIQELYDTYRQNRDDVIILGVAQTDGTSKSNDEIKDFLNKNNYNYPTVFDENGALFNTYFVSSIPTTYMINSEGKIAGYVTGSLSKEQMIKIINDTKESQ